MLRSVKRVLHFRTDTCGGAANRRGRPAAGADGRCREGMESGAQAYVRAQGERRRMKHGGPQGAAGGDGWVRRARTRGAAGGYRLRPGTQAVLPSRRTSSKQSANTSSRCAAITSPMPQSVTSPVMPVQ